MAQLNMSLGKKGSIGLDLFIPTSSGSYYPIPWIKSCGLLSRGRPLLSNFFLILLCLCNNDCSSCYNKVLNKIHLRCMCVELIDSISFLLCLFTQMDG